MTGIEIRKKYLNESGYSLFTSTAHFLLLDIGITYLVFVALITPPHYSLPCIELKQKK